MFPCSFAKRYTEETNMSHPAEKKSLVLHTGGTFSMTKNENEGLSPSNNAFKQIRCDPKLSDKPTLTDEGSSTYPELALPETDILGQRTKVIYQWRDLPVLLDSSNMKQDDWQKIAEEIKKNYQHYTGFVVVMGTDTMAYTASGLSFMLQNLAKPVVITGAQIPIYDPRSDASDNLLCALISSTLDFAEVLICIDKKTYRGNRTSKMDCAGFNIYWSPNMEALAVLDVTISVNAKLKLPKPKQKAGELNVAKLCNSDKVGILLLYPGITGTRIERFLEGLDGLVLLTFGCGNAPSYGGIYDALGKAVCNDVIIVNVTQCPKGSVKADYEVGQALVERGVISGGDMTMEAAFTKLSYVLAMENKSLQAKKEEMKKDLRGEMTDANLQNN